MSEVSPTARALRVLGLLQSQPGITAAELGHRLGVTERAARRYVAILREAEISVESTPGRHGGYRLGRGLRLPPLIFSTTEAVGLVMAALAGRSGTDDEDDPVGSALAKIIRALPSEVGREADRLRSNARTTPRSGSGAPDPAVTSELAGAVADRCRVRVGYRSASGSVNQGLVDPWGVVVRRGRWYLLCFAHTVDAVRAYRIDRITDLETTSERFRPPDELDPAAYLERHLGVGWEFETSVLFHAPHDLVAPWVIGAMGQLVPVAADRCRLTGSTSNVAMYAGEWLPTFPFPFTVEGGTELRAAVTEVADRMRAALGG